MMLLDAAAAWDASMAAWGASMNTRKCRHRLLEQLDRQGWPAVEEITRLHVEMFLGASDFKPWTRATYYTHLRTFFTWALEVELIDSDPMHGVRRPRAGGTKPKPLRDEQVDAVMEIARGHPRAWMLLALYAGLRAHEIAKIRGEDVQEHLIFVRGKGAKEASLPTHRKIWALAQQYPRTGWWFPSVAAEGHVSGNTVGIRVGFLFRDAGIEEGSIHRCRHTYATRLLRQGTNVRVVQDVMRHASLATTQVYLEVNDKERSTAIGLLT